MTSVLRFIGLANAAVWLGTAVFMTVAGGPAFFSETMIGLLGRPHAGAAAQVVWQSYFVLQYVCAGIAVVHLLTEWICLGRPFSPRGISLVTAMMVLVLWSGIWIQPKLRQLHLTIYGVRSLPVQAEQARRSFRVWHGVSQGNNMLVLLGLIFYLWQLSRLNPSLRFVPQTKFHLE